MANAKKVTSMVEEAADRLGALRAAMAELKAEAKDLENILVNSGESVVLGKDYRVTVSRSARVTVDYKGIALKLKASKYMLDAYSKTSNVTCVKVAAHKK